MTLNPFFSTPSNYPSKAAVIIDGGYWRQLLHSQNISKVDLVKLSDRLTVPAYRIRSYFFDGRSQDNQSFHDSLQLLDRFEVYLGEIVPRLVHCKKCEKTITIYAQKRVDVALAVELVHLATAKHVDLIVLIAGDRDFIPAIESAKHAGVIIRLVHGPSDTVSDTLLKLVDEKIELSSDYLDSVEVSFEKIPQVIDEVIEAENPEKIKAEIHSTLDLIEEITIQLLSQSTDPSINLSQIGIELKKRDPNWRENTKIKNLNKLVEMDDTRFIVKRQNSHYFISLTKTVQKPVPSEIKSLEDFLLQAITEHFHKTKEKTIALPKLGTLLHQKNPDWKKTDGVKKLSTAFTNFSHLFLVSGTNTKIRIGLK